MAVNDLAQAIAVRVARPSSRRPRVPAAASSLSAPHATAPSCVLRAAPGRTAPALQPPRALPQPSNPSRMPAPHGPRQPPASRHARFPDAVPQRRAARKRGNPPFYEVFGKRYYVLASARRLRRARRRLLVRPDVPRRASRPSASVRHVRHDGRAQDAAAAGLRARHQPEQRQERRGAHQRPRAVRRRTASSISPTPPRQSSTCCARHRARRSARHAAARSATTTCAAAMKRRRRRCTSRPAHSPTRPMRQRLVRGAAGAGVIELLRRGPPADGSEAVPRTGRPSRAARRSSTIWPRASRNSASPTCGSLTD